MSGPPRIDIRCSCGQVYHADAAHAGRSIRCRCGNLLRIAPPARRAAPDPPRRQQGRPIHPGRLRPRIQTLRGSGRARGLVRILSWGYLAAVLGYTGILWLYGDSWWPAHALLFGPRWPALVPAPFLGVGAVLVRPRLLGPLAAALLIALGPAMGYRIGWRTWFGTDSTRDIRLVTFNMRGEANPQALDLPVNLEPYGADIVAFQECDEGVGTGKRWPQGWTIRFDQGLCLATRFPVVEARQEDGVQVGDFGETGRAMLYRLRSPVGLVDLIVLHLETPRKGLESLRYGGDASRMNPNLLVREIGARRISRWVRRQSGEAIVAGDFNMPVESVIYRRYWGDCGNAFSSAGRGFGWTRVLRRFSVRIDHVLTCGGWRPIRAWVGAHLGSDHLPLIVDLVRVR